MNLISAKNAKSKIVLIDGYAGAGKSTCMGLLKEILGNDFNYIKKYTTRKLRIDEGANQIFSDCVCFNTQEFLRKQLDYVFFVKGVYYGIRKGDISEMLVKKYMFLIANEYFRKQIQMNFSQDARIIQVFVRSSKFNRIKRIKDGNLGQEQTVQRLEKLNANIYRDENDFDFVINNNFSVDYLKQQINTFITTFLVN